MRLTRKLVIFTVASVTTLTVLIANSGDGLRVNPGDGWNLSADGFELVIASAKTDWSKLNISLEAHPGKYYMLSWFAKSSSAHDGDKLIFSPQWSDKYQCGANTYYLSDAWLEYRYYFYSGETFGEVGFSALVSAPLTQTVSVKNVKLTELTMEGNPLADGGVWASGKYPALWYIDNYKTGQPYALTESLDDSSITGKSLSFQPGVYDSSDGLSQIKSIALPVEPGERYHFECWLKTSRDIPVRIVASNWFTPHRKKTGTPNEGHWFKIVQVAGNVDWRKISMDLVIPKDLTPYPDFQGRTIRIGVGYQENDVTLRLAGAAFSRLE